MADEVRLIDIIDEFISGDWGEESATAETPCAVSCVRGADIVPISNSRFENIPVRYISAASLKNRGLAEGDIIIEKSGGSPTQSTGRTVYVSKKLVEAKKDVVCSNFCQAFRIKDGWNPLYVYYYLQVVYNSGVFFNFEGKTSGLKNLILDSAFQSITIKKVPFEEQDRVANLLSLIDDKIAANHAINDYLEAMARQLYDYWFVQFDFPDENGNPYKTSGGAMVWSEELNRMVPKGWEVVSLGSQIESNRGISYDSSSISGGGVPMLNLASFNTDGSYKHKGLKRYNGDYTQERILKPFDLVMCNTQQTAIDEAKDIIGKAFLVPDIFNEDIVSSHHVTTMKCDRILKPYLAYLSNTKHFHRYAVGCCSGTNIMGLNFVGIEQYKMELPSKKVLQRFYDLIINNEREKGNAIKEVELLTSLREKLLHLLMNGQVSIKQLNNHLSAD